MPVSLRHTFFGALSGQQYTNNKPAIDLHTADFHAMHLGNGWKLKYMQSVMPKTFLHDGTRRSGYVYTDESGAQVYMIESTKFYFRRETPEKEGGEEYYLYEDLDDSGYLYDPKKREIYHCADTIFLTLPAVWSLCWTKTTTLCKSFPTPNGEKVQYQYTDGNLTSITARDGSITKLGYTADRLTAVSMYDGTHSWYEYKVEYTYDSAGRIQRVQE